MSDELDVLWIHGSRDCAANADLPLQVHAFDADTYILRQNKCHNFEAPFLYLLFGDERAVLLDTGADPGPGRTLPLRDVVYELIGRRAKACGGRTVSLVVAHTHSHGDHLFGDDQFAAAPGATVVPPTLSGVQAAFALTDWPDRTGHLDLGSRRLTVIPAPGHEPTHVVFHDPATRLLLTGDTLYPGMLFVRDWPAYRATVARLRYFAALHPIRHILGAHIEMTRTPGVAYPYGTTYQPDEHVLELSPRHLEELYAAAEQLGDRPARTIFDDFVLEPLGA